MTTVWPVLWPHPTVPAPRGSSLAEPLALPGGRLHLGPPWGLLGSCNDSWVPSGPGSLEMGYRFVESVLGFMKMKGVDPSKRWAVRRMASKLGT